MRKPEILNQNLKFCMLRGRDTCIPEQKKEGEKLGAGNSNFPKDSPLIYCYQDAC